MMGAVVVGKGRQQIGMHPNSAGRRRRADAQTNGSLEFRESY